jgi:hypothetical protein
MMQPGPQTASPRRVLRESAPAFVLAALVLVVCAYVFPKTERNPLFETVSWCLVVVVSFAGWGSLVRRVVAPKERVDLGLRVAWGAGLVCFVGGVLMVPALMTRLAALLVVDAGLVLALVSLALERRSVRSSVVELGRIAIRQPGLAVLTALVCLAVGGHFFAGVSDWRTNPYDDDIAYLAFVRKLLDTGTVLEPFSLRRLSALGGQNLFHELVALRAAPSQAHAFDRSIAVLMTSLLVAGHRSGARRPPLLMTLLAIVTFVSLPNVAINTASYYSGVAFFLALFRTIVWADQGTRPVWATAIPIALVGAATCTLRQNYMAVVVAALVSSYAFRAFASQGAWRSRVVEPAMAAGMSLVALVPWFVVGWQSNRTFLYPFMLGTANPALLLSSSAGRPLREAYLYLWTVVDGTPLQVLPLFVLAALLVREKRQRRPLASLAIGATAGVFVLVHAADEVEVESLRRYVFGPIIAFALAAALVAGTCASRVLRGVVRREQVAAAIVFFAMLGQLVVTREKLASAAARATNDIEALGRARPHSDATTPPEHALYFRLQQSVPPDARLAVMLDEPYWLDFRRNPIWNLDMPGYSSLPPGIPYFEGSERVKEYFLGIGVRYLAYVRPGFSRYHFRREYWLGMLVDENAIWRSHGPYLIDFLDSLEELRARHQRLFEERGLVVIDLEAEA